MSYDHDQVDCYQCGWPLLRGEEYALVYAPCDECSTIHIVGLAHQVICITSMALQETRVTTQHRRLVALRVN